MTTESLLAFVFLLCVAAVITFFVSKLSQGISQIAHGLHAHARAFNQSCASSLEYMTCEQLDEILLADPQVWASLTVDRLGLPLEYEEELDQAVLYCFQISGGEIPDMQNLYEEAVLALVASIADYPRRPNPLAD